MLGSYIDNSVFFDPSFSYFFSELTFALEIIYRIGSTQLPFGVWTTALFGRYSVLSCWGWSPFHRYLEAEESNFAGVLSSKRKCDSHFDEVSGWRYLSGVTTNTDFVLFQHAKRQKMERAS